MSSSDDRHDACVRMVLRLLPGSVVLSGAPAPVSVPPPARRGPVRPVYQPYPAYPVAVPADRRRRVEGGTR
jgi:hypothetical protein